MTELLTISPKEAQALERQYRIVSKSVDARQRNLRVNLSILLDEQGKRVPKDAPVPLYEPPHFQDVHGAEKVVYIVGAGPAGLFAALTLLEHGVKPVIFERGKEVSERKRDIALLNRNEGLNTESNYCFGEGGAGTFSDGKLFSRSKKRGNMQRVMELFHYFGAPDSVLYEAHAHIGSDRLPAIIRAMRECILTHGGEIHFETCFHLLDKGLRTQDKGQNSVLDEGLRIKDKRLKSIDSETSETNVISPSSFILNPLSQESLSSSVLHPSSCLDIIYAIGHSAHDTYRELAAAGVRLEPKGFAMGVRAEHPQALINRLMYHNAPQEIVDIVGNASYSLVTQVQGRGVYSFCMCPGGHIVPAGSTAGSCVVNGMSASHRNSPFANSGMVVEIRPEDICEHPTWETNLLYQERLEQLAFEHGAAASKAPAQRLRDFVEGKMSKTLPKTSYLPGVVSSRMDEWLPKEIGSRLQQGFRDFDRKYKGFLTNEAVILGVESRSSSAVRIPRDPETLQAYWEKEPLGNIQLDTSSTFIPQGNLQIYKFTNLQINVNISPAGEGAGYAGGITSSALDGINVAQAVIKKDRATRCKTV